MSAPAIAVIGAGAWGTALAQMLAADGRDVLLWALEPELAGEINTRHANTLYLPSATLAPTIRATSRHNLQRLVGKDLGEDPAAWQEWLRGQERDQGT